MKFLKEIKNLSWIFAILTLTPVFSQPIPVDGIAILIGQNMILKSDWDIQFQTAQQQAASMGFVPTKCAVLEELMLEKLLINQAEIDSVVASSDEVEATMDRRIEMLTQQIGSQRKLEEYYKKSIVEIKEEMRALVRNQLVAQKMQGTITDGLEITPSEVRDYYKRIPKDSLPLIGTELEIAQIVLYPKVRPESAQETIDRLNQLRERIAAGSNFSTLAVLYSEDPGSAKNGGEYKGIRRGQFVKEFEAVAFNLKKGQVSEPVKTEFGYHIIQLIEKRGEELDLKHILIKPKISDDDLNKVRLKMDSIRMLVLSGVKTFEQLAFELSEDESTRFNSGLMMNPNSGDSKWEVNQMDKSLFLGVDGLDAGQISEPFLLRSGDGKEGFRMVKVLSKTEPHRANLRDDYTRIQGMAMGEKRQETMSKWIKEKLEGTSVRINVNWVECDFKYDWQKNEKDERRK